MKILLIGNNGGSEQQMLGGQHAKTRLYLDLLTQEGFQVDFVELSGFFKRFPAILSHIKRGIKNDDAVLLMAGPKGARTLLPYLSKRCQKIKKLLVYSAIGIGTLESLLVGRLGPEQMNSFLTCQSFFGIKDERMKKCLAACDKVVLENETLNSVYKNFYGLSNTVVLQNFRLVPQNPLQKVTAPSDSVQLVYLSRVAEEKGIFDLIQAVKEINQEAGTVHFSLDIYGPIDLDSSTRQIFFGALTPNIVYKGTVKPEKSIETLSRYHLLCFPTKLREGTPGVIAESLIAGTPILSSNFAQAKELIAVGKDGFLFQISSFDSLKDSLKQIYLSRGKLIEMRSEALKMSVQFTYSGNRTIFLSLFSSSSGSNQ